MAFKMRGFSGFKQVQDPDWEGDGEWVDVEPGTYRGIGNYQKNTKTGQLRTWMPGRDIYDDKTTHKLDSMTNVIRNLPDWTSKDYDPDLKDKKIQEKKQIRKKGKKIGKEPNVFSYLKNKNQKQEQ